MPSPPITKHSGKMLTQLLLIGMVVQMLVVGYVFYQSYAGRTKLVHSQRAGCERSKFDRQANAAGWRIAEAARRAGGQIVVANRYRDIASKMEDRSRIKCDQVYPTAGILP